MLRSHRRRGLLSCSIGVLVAAAGLATSASGAWAAEAAVADAGPTAEKEVSEVVVNGAFGKAASVAPVRSALTATEPEAIITRKFIEESSPRVGDFSTIAVFAPSMSSTPSGNGPGVGDGGKLTLRGFSDGQYNVTYDGIAWGDTNGPSHHGTAFFPASTIGGVIIDRGPGGATELGQANFGGQINLFSLPLEDERSLTQVVTVGSWNTLQSVTTLQSGPVAQLHDASFLGNFQEYRSKGYLTGSDSHGATQLVKGSVVLADRFTVTGLFTHTHNFYNKSDIGEASVAQTEQFGRNFSLGSDPNLQNYSGYNWAKKDTDFEYIRASGELGRGFGVDNTLYSYAYDNDTLSGANNLAGASANKVTLTPAATYPAPGQGYSSALQVAGIPGYVKKNRYRVTGDILKFTQTSSVGTLILGVLLEKARATRFIFDVDLRTGAPDYREKAAKFAGPSGVYVQSPLNIQYYEPSGWDQYQPFAQFEWKASDRLTITPGVKYVHFDLFVHAPQEAIPNAIQPVFADQTYTKTLPFLTANYRIGENWAAYAQYAQGFLVPKIGNLYVSDLKSTRVTPQESTNYQLGTVLNLNKLTFDGDIYYIDFKHKIQSFTDAVTGQPYSTNSGGAVYKGIEVQATYMVSNDLSVFANASRNSAKGTDDLSNPLYNGHQLTGAPRWTAAAGVRFQHDGLLTSDDSLIVTLNDKWVGDQYTINAKCSSAPNGVCAPGAVLTPVTGRLKAYGHADLSATYRIGRYSLEAQVLNLTGSRDITSFKGSALVAGSDLPATTSAQGGGANALLYQTPRSYQVTLKARF